ncbi:hypothetical protein B0H19DRAFT_1182003 [Mycena capillaripes]|nr:hypothetical protein B0H19DRAFT_1182003 [Mycena capillaripes]
MCVTLRPRRKFHINRRVSTAPSHLFPLSPSVAANPSICLSAATQPLPHLIIKYILFQALIPALKYAEPKPIIRLASTTSGFVRPRNDSRLNLKWTFCSVCCSPSRLFCSIVQRIFCFPSMVHAAAAINGP